MASFFSQDICSLNAPMEEFKQLSREMHKRLQRDWSSSLCVIRSSTKQRCPALWQWIGLEKICTGVMRKRKHWKCPKPMASTRLSWSVLVSKTPGISLWTPRQGKHIIIRWVHRNALKDCFHSLREKRDGFAFIFVIPIMLACCST